MKGKSISCADWKRILKAEWIALASLVFSGHLALAQPVQTSESPRGMEERVSLDLRATEVTDALKYLATKGGFNLAISKNVTGRFDLILRSNELAYELHGTIYHVMTEAEYRALYGRRFSDLRKVKTFRLQYAIPQQAFNLLDTLKSEIGRLLVDEESGTVMIMDMPERLEKMEEALATLEKGGTVRVFDLKYAKAKEVEERLKDQIELNKLGYVKADERSNQIVVKTFPERMREVEKIISALDRKTREVLIIARIVKVTLNDQLNSGIDWDKVFANLKFHGMDTKSADFRTSTSGTPPNEVPPVRRVPFIKEGAVFGEKIRAGELLFGTISRDGYELFRYLETIGQTKVISNPRLLVTEGQEARIHVGTREAYVTTTTTTGQTTSTTAEEVEFVDVGIQLSVTPHINEDGYILMKVKPEVSSVVRTLKTPSNNEIPIVDTSTAETHVLVKDGTTVVIGGLRKNLKQFTHKQIPLLGRIPIVGELFRQRDKDNELQELVVFLTPHIVYGDELVTGDEERFGRGLKGFRDYAPILTEPGLPEREPLPLTTFPAPAKQREESPPTRLRLREEFRPYSGGG
jgi:type II secretory pathway component GspD/PulD (secretin)